MIIKRESWGYSGWISGAQVLCDKSGTEGRLAIGRPFTVSEVRQFRKRGVIRVA